jgi:predicted HD superfamily hydrolase involved in NAD metabolism
MTVYDLTQVREKLKDLHPELLAHCERVRIVCLQLAQRWGVPREKAEFAALTHDLARALEPSELLRLARSYKLINNDVDLLHPILLHGPVAAAILRYHWGIDDEEILRAVACHTAGCVNMTVLAKILFLADKTEEEKASLRPGLSQVRVLADIDLDQAVLEMMDRLILFHVENKHPVHPSCLAARNYLLMKIEKKG